MKKEKSIPELLMELPPSVRRKILQDRVMDEAIASAELAGAKVKKKNLNTKQ